MFKVGIHIDFWGCDSANLALSWHHFVYSNEMYEVGYWGGAFQVKKESALVEKRDENFEKWIVYAAALYALKINAENCCEHY